MLRNCFLPWSGDTTASCTYFVNISFLRHSPVWFHKGKNVIPHATLIWHSPEWLNSKVFVCTELAVCQPCVQHRVVNYAMNCLADTFVTQRVGFRCHAYMHSDGHIVGVASTWGLHSTRQPFLSHVVHVTFGYFRMWMVFANPHAVGIRLSSCTNDNNSDIYQQPLSESSPKQFSPMCMMPMSSCFSKSSPRVSTILSSRSFADSDGLRQHVLLPKSVA